VRVPLPKISVGVPVMLYFWPNSRLRVSALVSHSAASGATPRTIQSVQALALSLAHQMLRDFTTESGPSTG
jgi:hypothetical protein